MPRLLLIFKNAPSNEYLLSTKLPLVILPFLFHPPATTSTMRRVPSTIIYATAGRTRIRSNPKASDISYATITASDLLLPISSAIRPKAHLRRRDFSTNLPSVKNDENAISCIDFTTSSTTSGEESQILEVKLREGEMLRAESGAMLYM